MGITAVPVLTHKILGSVDGPNLQVTAEMDFGLVSPGHLHQMI